MLLFKKNTRLGSYTQKINNTLVDNTEDLDIVMPMYDLLECSDIYSMRSGSLWNYYRVNVNEVVVK